jgi:hypothetical protein
MASTADHWSLEAECPPLRAVEYRRMARKVVAEWLRAAGVTCREDYNLTQVVEAIEVFVVKDLRAQAVRHSLPVGDLIAPVEDDQ